MACAGRGSPGGRLRVWRWTDLRACIDPRQQHDCADALHSSAYLSSIVALDNRWRMGGVVTPQLQRSKEQYEKNPEWPSAIRKTQEVLYETLPGDDTCV